VHGTEIRVWRRAGETCHGPLVLVNPTENCSPGLEHQQQTFNGPHSASNFKLSSAPAWSLQTVTDPTALVRPSAVLIGNVIVRAGCYIGPHASLHRDFGGIRVPAGANVRDFCIRHGFPGTDTVVQEDGHGAVLHICVIGRDARVGMNAVVNDNVLSGESAFVAAMAFVKAGTVVAPRTLVAGIPAKTARELTAQELPSNVEGTLSTSSSPAAALRRCRATAPRPSRIAVISSSMK
jgi:phenylacetic acid degradation protein